MTALDGRGDSVRHAHLPTENGAEQIMGMPAVALRRWSADDVRALPDDPRNRYETVDGVLLVSPSPARVHQYFQTELLFHLSLYLRSQHVAVVVGAPSDVELDPFTLMQPDVYSMPLIDGRRPLESDPDVPILLAVEILSPSTARHDRLIKRPRLQRAAIECWLVDLDARLVERWTPDAERPEILIERLTWMPPGATQPFELALQPLFADVLGSP